MLAKPVKVVAIAGMLAMTIEITGRLWGHKIARVFTALSVGISFAVWFRKVVNKTFIELAGKENGNF